MLRPIKEHASFFHPFPGPVVFLCCVLCVCVNTTSLFSSSIAAAAMMPLSLGSLDSETVLNLNQANAPAGRLTSYFYFFSENPGHMVGGGDK